MIPTFLRPERIPYASLEIVPASPLRLICSWCTTQVQDGALPASHTICQVCTKKFEGGARGVATMVPFVLALCIAAPASAQERIGRLPYAVLVAGQASDLITTLESLHSGRGREGNALWSSSGTAGFVAIKTSSALAMGFAMKQLASHGHPRAAKVLGYVSGFALVGVGVHNARVGR